LPKSAGYSLPLTEINYLYEAVYFFDKINGCVDHKIQSQLNQEEMNGLGINESIYKAMMRILVVNNLLDYDGSCFVMTKEQNKNYRDIMYEINSKNKNNHYKELFHKAVNDDQFFFDRISELEYEIYSRCNFPITFETGKEVVQHVNLANKKVLEIGGNSGGFGTAILTKYEDCRYFVVDTKIPCMIGNEFKDLNKINITFIEGNVFELMLLSEGYDYIIIMNLLHDFDDIKCLDILRNCKKYSGSNTKFLIIEDILTSEFEPKEVIMHGLRLSIECKGGKQRTIEEFDRLFLKINYTLEKTIKLNNIHTMLIMGAQ